MTNMVWWVALAAKNAVSSTPNAVMPASRSGWSTSGRPYSRTAAITVARPTPRAAATWATEWPS